MLMTDQGLASKQNGTYPSVFCFRLYRRKAKTPERQRMAGLGTFLLHSKTIVSNLNLNGLKRHSLLLVNIVSVSFNSRTGNP